MPTTINVKITNLPQIKAAFAKAPTRMAKNLNDAIRKASIAIQRQSMINSPVLTGRLRASHQTIFGPLKATIMPNVDYAIYVHEGTRYMRKRPFLYDAVQSEQRAVDDYFRKAVQDTLDEIARDV
jgi:HK97 gp10 family phage protein